MKTPNFSELDPVPPPFWNDTGLDKAFDYLHGNSKAADLAMELYCEEYEARELQHLFGDDMDNNIVRTCILGLNRYRTFRWFCEEVLEEMKKPPAETKASEHMIESPADRIDTVCEDVFDFLESNWGANPAVRDNLQDLVLQSSKVIEKQIHLHFQKQQALLYDSYAFPLVAS